MLTAVRYFTDVYNNCTTREIQFKCILPPAPEELISRIEVGLFNGSDIKYQEASCVQKSKKKCLFTIKSCPLPEFQPL